MADHRHTEQTTVAPARRRRRSSADRTAAALDPRSGDGWWVLHDLAVPGADHVVVTPGGVWVVASCAALGPAAIELDGVRVGAALVERALATSPVGLMVPVRAVVSSTSERAAWSAGPVEVVPVAGIVRALAGLPTVCTMAEVDHVTELVDAAFGNRRGASTSVVRPAPQPPASPDLPVLHPSGRVVTGAPSTASPAGHEQRLAAELVVDLRPWRVVRRLATMGFAATAVALAVVGLQQLGA